VALPPGCLCAIVIVVVADAATVVCDAVLDPVVVLMFGVVLVLVLAIALALVMVLVLFLVILLVLATVLILS